MKPAEKSTIVLVNQISKHGHLDLYARLYSLCLLDLGYRVVLVAEQESGIPAWIAKNWNGSLADFIFWPRDGLKQAKELNHTENVVPAAGTPSVLSRAWRIWKKEGPAGLLLRVDLRTRRYRHWIRWRLDVAVSRIESHLPWTSHWLRLVLGRSRRGVSFVPLVQELGVAFRRLGTRPDLVVFLYLDMIDDDRRGCRYLDRKLDVPWAGILFNPLLESGLRFVTAERFFHCQNARGAAFLNPLPICRYEKMFPTLSFGEVPDVTEISVPDNDSQLAANLRSAAKGRTIVLLSGSLAPHKGVMQFINVIQQADKDRFFFAIVGELFWESFGGDEPRLRKVLQNPPENCFVHLGYLEDERELNGVIASADILYAVYKEWRVSSNTLTKAAMLRKPVIVDERFLMGERVRRYDIGATVRVGHTDDVIASLERLRRRSRDEFGFDAYGRDHSIEALKVRLKGLLKRWAAVPQTLNGQLSGSDARTTGL